MKTIYKANILYTRNKSRFEVMENGYIAVDSDGRVTGVATDLASLDSEGVQVVDYGDCLLVPAMNDLHVHASQYRNQGLAMDLELMQWLQRYTYPEEMKYADTEYAELIYRRFVRDLWRFGTMRSCIFATIHTESTRLLMRLLQDAGMGAMVGKVAMDRNCPEPLVEPVGEMVNGFESLVEEFSSLVRPIVTPRFVPSCTPQMLHACGQLAAKHHLPVQSHLSENRDEMATVESLEGTWYGDAYDRYGLFGQTPTVMAHCVYTEGSELELMRQRGVMVAHCPTSNLNVSTGIAPIRRFLDEGIRVGLGSDISGGHDLSIFCTMVYAIQVSKVRYQQDHSQLPLTLSEAFWMATKSGGSFFGRVGSFEPGYDFDALVIDDSDLNHDRYSLQERLERYIYLGDDRQIVHRFCCGKEISMP